MGTTWVLHTETKGTGAQMVPLEKTQQRAKGVQPQFVAPRKRTRPAKRNESAPPRPRKFKIIDVLTRRALVDGVGIADALEALRQVRSVVDVNVYVWEEERARWRAMTFEEQHALIELAAEQAA